MNRVDCILNYLQPNHKVLHVGCCDDDHIFVQKWKAGTTLHKYLHDLLGDNLIGVDINEKRVRELNDKGMKTLVGDAHNLPKSIGKFDVIVAGEVIEHLENPGLFLRSARQLLREGSRLILTTPNVLGVLFWLRHGVLKKKEPWPEHVCYTKLKLSCPHVSSACNHQPKPVKRANRSGALRKACNTSLNAVSNAALVSKTRLDKAPRKTSNQRSTGFS